MNYLRHNQNEDFKPEQLHFDSSNYHPLYDLEAVSTKSINAFHRLVEFRSKVGAARRNLFASKYYVNDDFEDPLFFMESVFYKIVSYSATDHEFFVHNMTSVLKDNELPDNEEQRTEVAPFVETMIS